MEDKRERRKALFHRNFNLRDAVKTAVILAGAYIACSLLLAHTSLETDTALVYVLAVVVISRITSGYFFGVVGSILSAFIINYFFMFPYAKLNFTLAGYPVAFLCMLVTSLTVCTLTSRSKRQAEQAVAREQQTVALYKLNEKLARERESVRMEAEKEKMRGNLLRAVSHDLRTPLTGISGASATILENLDKLSREEIVTLLTNINEDSQWLYHMVENLLSVTRLNSEGASLKKQPEAAEEVAAVAVMKIRKRFPGQKVELELPEELLLAPMDAMLVEQVLINLLENSIRHAGNRAPVVLRVFRDGERVVFEVRDSGKGLSQEKLLDLREGRELSPEETGDQARGAGIGLSVCRSIIKAHNGVLEADNLPDGGAMLRVILQGETDDGQ